VFKLIFYDFKEIEAFMLSLRKKLAVKVENDFKLLEEYGNMLRMPHSEKLDDNIFELRVKQGSDIVRVLYFFDKGRIIVVANAYMKKKNKIDPSMLKKANDIRKQYYKKRGE